MVEGTLTITFKKGKKSKKSNKPRKITVQKILRFNNGQTQSIDNINSKEISEALTQKIADIIENQQNQNISVEFKLEQGNQIKKLKEKGTDWDREEEVFNIRQDTNANPLKNRANNRENNKTNDQEDFYNPYNFIPSPSRHQTDTDLDDRKPTGHGKYHSKYWSGNIAVTLTTETPLLIPDASKAEEDNKKHKTYDIRKDSDGKPILPITSVKGMLRSEYEAITNSRYGIFQKHEDRLAYRTPAKSTVKPARVEKKENKFFLRIMDDNSLVGNTARLKRYDKKSNRKDKGENKAATKYQSSKTLPKHGDSVWVKLNKGKVVQIIPHDENPDDTTWKKGWVCVTGANINSKMNERVFIENSNDDLIPVTSEIQSLWEELIRNYQQTHIKDLEKRQDKNQKPTDYLGSKPGDTAWSKHIWDKKELEFKEGTLCYVEFDNNEEEVVAIQPVTISRRLYQKSPDELLSDRYDLRLIIVDTMDELVDKGQSLVVVALVGKTALHISIFDVSGKQVVDKAESELIAGEALTQLQRRLDPFPNESNLSLVEKQEIIKYATSSSGHTLSSLKPATDKNKLSPADRVFGWVNQNGKGSYKGNLRINSMVCQTEDAIATFADNYPNNPTLPLNILGKPQESQAKFYQAINKNGDPLINGTQKQDGYSESSQGLRGRKVYPHQNLSETHWDNPTIDRTQEDNNDTVHHQEYHRPPRKINVNDKNKDKYRDDQNRSIKAWVQPNTQFTFNIEITNLSSVELGALLWLLDLNDNDHKIEADKTYYHRLGGGKPYGFGSVKLEVDWEKSDLRSGEGWKEYYSSLLDETTHKDDENDDAKKMIETYQNAIVDAYGDDGNNQSFENVSFIKAFNVYSKGYQKNLPIHYPRLQSHPNNNSPIFEWFTENDAVRNDGNNNKIALPALSEDKGLPYQPHE